MGDPVESSEVGDESGDPTCKKSDPRTPNGLNHNEQRDQSDPDQVVVVEPRERQEDQTPTYNGS
ncbi:MAG: hypothetical protein CMH54_07105 [Myxococcales bacterium]|nr:hypothetical protein [Myxococcales bacterium]